VKCFLVALLVLLSFSLVNCGQVFVSGSMSFSDQRNLTGTVSLVQFTIAEHDGISIMVTAVTLINAGSPTTINFCGDQRMQFPLNQSVRTSFRPGSSCSTMLTVIIT
jgi:hypothetical protein